MEEMTLLEKILDENNDETIVLLDEEQNEVHFEQIAVIPLEEKLYVILRPIDIIKGIEEDEALVFLVIEDEDDLVIEQDMTIVKKVFDEYYKLLEEWKRVAIHSFNMPKYLDFPNCLLMLFQCYQELQK